MIWPIMHGCIKPRSLAACRDSGAIYVSMFKRQWAVPIRHVYRLRVILPRERSYTENSISTRSPRRILILCCRILPEITPITGFSWPSTSTRNMALGKISTTWPSMRNCESSLAKFELDLFQSIPAETAPGVLIDIPDHAHVRVGFFGGFIFVFVHGVLSTQ